MRLSTLFLYLIGNRQAILDIAANRRAIWVGLLFVFSAAFAREYDGQYLVAEPWYLLIPMGASLGASFLLFLVVCGHLYSRSKRRPPFLKAYRSFLTLFWMTAPLAWLYAIPYERFLTPTDATKANLRTLAFVAAWRVALMVRVTSVITKRSIVTSFCMVVSFVCAVAIILTLPSQLKLMAMMGGVRQIETEAITTGMVSSFSCLAVLILPVCFFAASRFEDAENPIWQVPTDSDQIHSTSRGIWVVATLSLSIWIPLLTWTQREQELRYHVEKEMKNGRVDEALDLMSAHRQEEFPPQWEPQHIIGKPKQTFPHLPTSILEVMEHLAARDSAPWVREAYLKIFQRDLMQNRFFWFNNPDKLARIVNVFRQLPEGPSIAAEFVNEELKSNPYLDKNARESLKHFLDLVQHPNQ
jgi:hypothetical protein